MARFTTSKTTALIRTYNSDRTLADCLHSLEAQSLPPEHVVVVDSGSTDDTLSIARSYEADIAQYPSHEKFNYSRAINVGMQRVDTEYTLILSSHVELPDPETLRVLLDLLFQDESRCAASVRGMADSADEAQTGEIRWDIVTEDNFVSRYGGIAISNSCNLIPTALWRRHPFDESIPRCEDQKWLQYYLEQGWTAARVQSPQIVYDNPYYNDTKEVRDLVTLAEHGINPTMTEWSSLAQRTREALGALRHANWRNFAYDMRVVVGLLRVRFGIDTGIESKYF